MRATKLAAVVCLFLGGLSLRLDASAAPSGEFWVHGRLRAYCGGPGWRIWVVGTKRILGVSEGQEPTIDQGCMPHELYALALSEPDVTGTDIFGDYLVRPVTQDAPGEMRIVQVMDAKNLVILFRGRYVKRQASIDPAWARPNHPTESHSPSLGGSS